MNGPRSGRSVAGCVVDRTATTSEPAGAAATLVEPLPAPTGGFASGVYLPLNDLAVSGGSGELLLNGNLSLTWADTAMAPTVDEDGELTALRTELGLRGAVTLDLHAATGGDFEETFELVTVPVGTFVAGPARITVYLGLNLRISGEADAGVQVGLVAPFNVTAALEGTDAHPATSIPAPPAFDPEFGLPDLAGAGSASLTIELESTLIFQISVPQLPLPIGGPVFATSVGTIVNVQPGGTPWWRLSATAGVAYGWSFPDATGFPEPPRRLRDLIPERRWRVARAHDAGPVEGVSTRWSTAYDVLDNGDIAGLLADGDRLTVLQAAPSPDAFPWLATLDGVGNPVAQAQTTELVHFDALARTADGGVLGVNTTGEIWRFDDTGSALWGRSMEVAGAVQTRWNDVVGTAEGSVMIGSTYASDRPVVLGLDHDGQLRWLTEIALDAPYEGSALTALAAAPDGSVIAVGSTRDSSLGPARDFDDLLVVRIDANGAVVSAVAHGGPGVDTATDVAVQPDGSYAVLGETGGDAVVARFDHADQLLWSGSYRDSEDVTFMRPQSVAAIGSGDYVATGFTELTDRESWLIRIDATGMPVWSKTFTGADDDKLTDVVAMPTGVAAAGDTKTADADASSPDSSWVVRTSVDGMVHFDPSSGLSAVNRHVQWSLTDGWTTRSLTFTTIPVELTVTDQRFGTVPAAAIVRTLT